VGPEYTNVGVTYYFRNSARLSSCDLVLVCETAEHLPSAGPVLGEVDLRWPGCELELAAAGRGRGAAGAVL
jgi:hypothetical protein